MKISNLAVCFYGQYRTGDICVPHIKHMLDMIEDMNVDIFCSVKNTVSYHTADGSVNHEDIRNVYLVSTDDQKHIANFLSEHLTPKKLHFVTDDPSFIKMQTGVRPDFFVFTGIIDAFMLKQQYEAETGIYYDAVLLLRYDIMARPLDYIKKFIRSLQDQDDIKIWSNDPDSMFAAIVNDAFLMQTTHPYSLFPNSIHDLFVAFTGCGADRLCNELISLVNDVTGLYTNQQSKYLKYTHMYDCHTMLTYLSDRISLPIMDVPPINKHPITKDQYSGEIGALSERANCNLRTQPMFALARPHSDIIGLDPSLNDDFDKIISVWIHTPDK